VSNQQTGADAIFSFWLLPLRLWAAAWMIGVDLLLGETGDEPTTDSSADDERVSKR